MANPNNVDVPNDESSADTQHHLTRQALEKTQGSDDSIPLSPQWLLAKPAENKHASVAGDPDRGPYPGSSSPSSVKSSPYGKKILVTEKNRDLFKPSLHDRESGRLDDWRDEERDTSSAIQRDRRREGCKDLSDTGKMERLMDNRKSYHDKRRESKWSMRWGPDEESKRWDEKWFDTSRDFGLSRNKGLPYLSEHGKEREGGHYRPQGSNTAHSYKPGDPSHHRTLTSNKEIPSFGHGRSHGEDTPLTVNRGRVNFGGNFTTSISSSLSSAVNKVETDAGEHFPLRYSRIQLLNVYRMNNLTPLRKTLDALIDVPSLTQEEPTEPLALSAPTSDELVILKGIDKGDIVSSGVPQVSKDGSIGRNKLEDLACAFDDYEDETSDNLKGPYYEKYGCQHDSDSKLETLPRNQSSHNDVEASRENGLARKKYNEFAVSGKNTEQRSASLSGTPWRSNTMRDKLHVSSDEVGPRDSGLGLSQLQKDRHAEWWEVSDGFSSSGDFTIKRQSSEILVKERNAKKCFLQRSPKELSFYYKDPQGEIQGPFSRSDLIEWFEAGFFGINLEVRPEGASSDTPFSKLGDAIPQLRAKAMPPPGFGVPAKSETVETLSGSNFSGFGKLHAGFSETDILQNEPRNGHKLPSEAENRMLESFISSNLSLSSLELLALSEGLRGYSENNSVGKLAMGVEKENELNFLLAQKLRLGHQRSFPLLHLLADSSLSQNMDLVSMIRASVEKSSPDGNKGAADCFSFLGQGGNGTSQDMMDTHQSGIKQEMLHSKNQPSYANTMGQSVEHSPSLASTEKLLLSVLPQDPKILQELQERQQQILLQLQQQLLLQKQLLRQREQNNFSQVLQSHLRIDESSSVNLQPVGTPPGYAPNDNFGFQAPHEMLQTDFRVPACSKQVSLSESFATLPSQVLDDVTPGSVSVDNLGLRALHEMLQPNSGVPAHTLQDTTCYATLCSRVSEDVAPGSVPIENLGLLAPHEIFQTNSQVPSHISQDALTTSCAIFPSQVRKQVDHVRSSEAFVPLPHQLFENTTHTKCSDAILSEQLADFKHKDFKVSSADILEESQYIKNLGDSKLVLKELKDVEVHEVKNVSWKNPKKQKKSKSQTSSDQAKLMPMPTSQLKQPENVGRNTVGKNFEKTVFVKSEDKSWMTDIENVVSGHETSSSFRSISSREVDISQGIGELREDEPLLWKNNKTPTGHRAWKPAPNPKVKSLLEIQQEEQCRSETDVTDSDFGASFKSNISSFPWAGVASNLKLNSSFNGQQNAGNAGFNWGTSEYDQDLRSKKSNLHDLLAEEVLANSCDIVEEAPDNIFNPSLQPQTIEEDSSFDGAIIETTKTQKKSAKDKSVAVQVLIDYGLSDVSVSCPIEKGKYSHPKQTVVSTILSDPNIEHFVHWKSDASDHLPPPAWSTGSGRLSKPTSLRDIQKQQEQEAPSSKQTAPMQTHMKAHSTDSGELSKVTSLRDIQKEQQQKALSPKQAAPVPTPMKPHSKQRTSGIGATQPFASSSPSKVESPIQINALASAQPKLRAEDELFWGPPDISSLETTRLGFPSIVNSSTLKTKTTPVKGTLVGLSSQQNSSSSTPAANYQSVSSAAAQSSLKERKDTATIHSDAMIFRAWCESELMRLTGSNDPSLLAFCLKQPASEAEMLLDENLGAHDPDHKFIDTFLNHKNVLSADVLEIAFQALVDQNKSGSGGSDINSNGMHSRDADPNVDANRDGPKGGGKKKGKKGKKVSSPLLGFNVVSNRIMMGEIQSVEN